jgi:hypothetical protein
MDLDFLLKVLHESAHPLKKVFEQMCAMATIEFIFYIDLMYSGRVYLYYLVPQKIAPNLL